MWYNPLNCHDEDSSAGNDRYQRAVYGVRRQPAACVNITSEQQAEIRWTVGPAGSSRYEAAYDGTWQIGGISVGKACILFGMQAYIFFRGNSFV